MTSTRDNPSPALTMRPANDSADDSIADLLALAESDLYRKLTMSEPTLANLCGPECEQPLELFPSDCDENEVATIETEEPGVSAKSKDVVVRSLEEPHGQAIGDDIESLEQSMVELWTTVETALATTGSVGGSMGSRVPFVQFLWERPANWRPEHKPDAAGRETLGG